MWPGANCGVENLDGLFVHFARIMDHLSSIRAIHVALCKQTYRRDNCVYRIADANNTNERGNLIFTLEGSII